MSKPAFKRDLAALLREHADDVTTEELRDVLAEGQRIVDVIEREQATPGVGKAYRGP